MRLLVIVLLLLSPCLARSQGTLTACKSNLKNIATALEMYATDHTGRYPSSLNQLTPNYLRAIPQCPSARRDTYSENYQRLKNPDAFGLCCAGQNHQVHRSLPANFPAYDSYQGLVESPPARHDPDQCLREQAELAGEIEAYRRDRGQLPEQVQGRFLYSTEGDSFRLSCPPSEHLVDNLKPFQPHFGEEVRSIRKPTTPVALGGAPRLDWELLGQFLVGGLVILAAFRYFR